MNAAVVTFVFFIIALFAGSVISMCVVSSRSNDKNEENAEQINFLKQYIE